MTYTELVAAIKSYTENDYSTTDVNTFIQNAEQRIHNTVQLPDLRKNVTGTMSSGNKYFSLPSDWLSTFSIAVINSDNEYTYLLNKDVNFVRESFPDTDSGFFGKPEYYGIFDDSTMILGPTPDANYKYIIHYNAMPTGLGSGGDGNSNTYLSNYFPQGLLYACLVEAFMFLKGPTDMLTLYENRYKTELQKFAAMQVGRRRRDDYTDGTIRIPIESAPQ